VGARPTCPPRAHGARFPRRLRPASPRRRSPARHTDATRTPHRRGSAHRGGHMATISLYEIAGTAMLTLLGGGVVANVVLGRTKGNGGGWLLINFGWGLAVFAGVFVAYRTGAHINPAVTTGILFSDATEYADGIPITAANTIAYYAAEVIGAFVGAVLAWLAYQKHYDA